MDDVGVKLANAGEMRAPLPTRCVGEIPRTGKLKGPKLVEVHIVKERRREDGERRHDPSPTTKPIKPSRSTLNKIYAVIEFHVRLTWVCILGVTSPRV
jgi:hypothetical protein